MRQLCIPFLLFAFIFPHSPALAPEPPLALSASVQGQTLTVVAFSTAPTDVQVRVALPPGWTSPQALDVRVSVGVAWVGVWQLAPGVGLGVIRVRATDARGNSVAGRAYATGAITTAADPVGIRRRFLPIVRR